MEKKGGMKVEHKLIESVAAAATFERSHLSPFAA